MRDIRPVPNSKSQNPPPRRPIDMPARRIHVPGENVPVTTVHVPKPSQPAAHVAASPATADKRPLFFRRKLGEQSATPKPSAGKLSRVGYKERKVLFAFFGLAVLMAALAAYIFLPYADIKLVLHAAPLLVDQKLTIRAQNTDADDVIPGTAFFREVQVDGQAPVVNTQVIGAKASGSVTLINHTSQEQKIKENSRLVTSDGVLFYMQKPAFVPANGSITVAVDAAESGPSGNIQPQKLYFAALPDSARAVLYGDVTKAFTGGSGDTIHVVAQSDLDNAKKAAGQDARGKAEGEIRAELPKGWKILEASWTSEVQSFDTSVKVDDKQPVIPYKATVTVRVLGYEESKLKDRLQKALTDRLDKAYMLFPGDIAYTMSVDSVDWQQAQAAVTARVTHMTIPQLSVDALKDKLSGLSSSDAKQYLEGLTGVQSVGLSFWPFWVNSVPTISNRIHVTLQPDQTGS